MIYFKGMMRRFAFRYFSIDYGTDVVVCGPPRSGTSLAFTQICGFLPDFNVALPRGSGKSREVSALNYSLRPGSHIGKKPGDLLRISDILETTIKRTIFVIMMRDPRDILVSKHQWYNAREYWVYPTRQCAEARGASEKHARFGLLEYLSALRNLVGTRNTSSSDIMYGASYEILRYEDLVSGEIQIPEILERMGISVNADRYSLNTGLPYDLSERATQPLEKRSSTWSSGDDRAKVLLDFGLYPELHDYMKFFGYEENDAWYQALANENEIFWQNNR